MPDILNSICAFEHDTEVGCIVMTWHSYASSAQLHEIHERFLKLVVQHEITKAISDTREMVMLSAPDQEWIVQDLVPRLLAAGLRYSGIIVPVSHFVKIGVENVVRQVRQEEIKTAYFQTVPEAKKWLASV